MSNFFASPWIVAHQAPLSMGFPMQEYWSGLLFSFPGNLLDPQIKPESPPLAGGFFFTTEPSAAAAAAKLLQSCPTLCSPIDGSPPASPVPELKQHLHVDILYYSISVQLLGSTDYFRYFTMLFFHRKITLSRKISRAGLKNCEFFSYSFQYFKK